MSRIDDFEEMLDDAENRGSAKPAPKKLWRHDYETIDSKTEIATPSKIKGRFVYQDETNTVKVSYIGSYVTGAPELSNVDDIQVQLYSKKTPESIESLVTLKSDEMYRKERLQQYVNELHVIEEETKDEKNEFAIFRGAFIVGLNEVIRKIIDGMNDKDKTIEDLKNLYSPLNPYKYTLPKDKGLGIDLLGLMYTVGHGTGLGLGTTFGTKSKEYLPPKKTLEELLSSINDMQQYKDYIIQDDIKNSEDIKDKIIDLTDCKPLTSIYSDFLAQIKKLFKKSKKKEDEDKPDAEKDDEDSDDGKDQKHN